MRVPQEMYLAGRWEPGAGELVTSVNPADRDDVVFEAGGATVGQVERAVGAAAEAFERWRRVPAPERARHLGRAAAIARGRAEELARALTREEGKILADARAEVDKGIDILEHFAAEGWRLSGKMLASETPATMAYTRREPLGVVGLVTPWNVPFALPCWKVAPALVAGNTAVLKPSNLAPGMALLLAALFEEAELPPGVLQVVVGSGSVVGRALAEHREVRALSFTGSPGARGALYQRVSERMNRLCALAPEAGGKNAAVVLADADLELASAGILHGAFASTGQRCTATSRVIVEAAVAGELVERLAAGAARIVVGDGLRSDTDMGPVIDGRHLDRLLAAVDAAKAAGIRLLTGGDRITDGQRARGYFMAPTLFDEVDPRSPLARHELFGPIVAISRVACFEEALAVANESPYRLAGALYTRDAAIIMRYIERAEARMVHINAPTIGGEPHQPYGGIRSIGVGELAREGVDFFTEVKTVFVDYGSGDDRRVYY